MRLLIHLPFCSVQYGRPAMPFDGILIASRIMVAKEASTCIQQYAHQRKNVFFSHCISIGDDAKKLLVEAPGVDHVDHWENTYTGVAGGVITVK